MRRPPLRLFLAVLCGAPSLSGQQVFHDLFGRSGEDGFGFSMCTAGDQDGDGYDDVFVGRPGTLTTNASIFSGFDGSLIHRFWGDAESGYGVSVTNLGDLDNDEFDDLAVGAPFGFSGAGFDGAVFVYAGNGPLLYIMASQDLPGDVNPRFGMSLAFIDDVDFDDHRDLLVGAPWEPADGVHSGFVWLLSGQDGTWIRRYDGTLAADGFGRAVSSISDLDGDGFAEILIGAELDSSAGAEAGRVYLYSAKDGSLLRTWNGPAAGAHFGQAIAATGDLDGDGLPDLIIGADDAARVYSGGSGALLATLAGPAGAVAGVANLDHDQVDDLVVGDAGAHAERGEVRFYSGANAALLQRFEGDADGDRLGTAVAAAGNVNGDRHGDVLAGAPGSDLNGANGGLARIYSGAPFGLAVVNPVAGERSAALAYHLRPRHPTGLWVSLIGLGSTDVPDFGVQLDLAGAFRPISMHLSSPKGRIAWDTRLPLWLLGRRLWFQAAQQGLVTPVVSVVVH